jgi:hypothetical protein
VGDPVEARGLDLVQRLLRNPPIALGLQRALGDGGHQRLSTLHQVVDGQIPCRGHQKASCSLT